MGLVFVSIELEARLSSDAIANFALRFALDRRRLATIQAESRMRLKITTPPSTAIIIVV